MSGSMSEEDMAATDPSSPQTTPQESVERNTDLHWPSQAGMFKALLPGAERGLPLDHGHGVVKLYSVSKADCPAPVTCKTRELK